MSTEAEALGERIAEMAAHLDAATHRLLTDLRDFDRSGNWNKQGARSCADWLSWRVGWSLGTARDHVRVAQRLGELPLIDDALRKGEISYSKVRAMVRVATPANEAMLLEDARHSTGQQLEIICRKYATVVRSANQLDEDEDRKRRTVWRHDLEDGMVRIVATLHAEEAALVMAALDHVARERCKPAEVSAAVQASSAPEGAHVVAACRDGKPDVIEDRPRGEFNRADALVAMAHGIVRGDRPRRSPFEVVVTVAADVLSAPDRADSPIAAFADGTCVSAETARRLSCDCGVVHVTEDSNGNALTVGRKTRSIPGAIKRALLKRDRCCRFPGCTNRLFIEGHHMKHWADEGETSLKNLVSTCSFHHRFVHEYGYRVELDEAQRPRFFDSSGREVLDVPGRPTPQILGLSAIVGLNEELEIDENTNTCLWDGSSPQYGDIIDALSSVDGL